MSDIPIHVLLLAGSAEHPSHVRANQDILMRLLQERKANTNLWDLYEDPLPIFNSIYHNDPHKNESDAVRRLAQLADKADAFVWASPVYHNSFSGVLKNALDSLTIRQFRHKPVALVSCGNNDRTGAQPSVRLSFLPWLKPRGPQKGRFMEKLSHDRT